MKSKFLITILLIISIGLSVAKVNANILDDIISQGSNFTGNSEGIGNKLSEFISGDIMDSVLLVGNLVFAGVTVVLGAKYIWSSAEGKSQVMESLPGFVLAVVFFYLGGNLVSWLTAATGDIAEADSWNTIAGSIIWIINTIVRYVAFGGIIFLGLKYMFAAAEARSIMKANMGALVIGIIFVFLASNVVDYIISVSENILS